MADRKPRKPAKRRCAGKTRAGKRCKAAPLRGRKRCSAHQLSPAAGQFGTPEAAARGGRASSRHVPKLTEVLTRRLEEEAERIVGTLVDGLGASRGVTIRIGGGEDTLVDTPDHSTRIAAARELLDRGLGRPKQATEVSGPDGGPVETTVDVGDPRTRELIGALLRRRQAAGD